MANLNDVKDDIKTVIKDGKEHASKAAHKGLDKTSDAAEELKGKAKVKADKLRNKGTKVKNKVFGYVSKNPWKTVAVSALAVAVLTKLLN